MELIDHIEKALLSCQAKILSTEGDGNSVDPRERYYLSPSLSSQNNLKCVISLKTDMIYEADIRLTRGATVSKASINVKEGHGTPYKVQQIQDCLNYIKRALEKIQLLKFCGLISDDLIKSEPAAVMELFIDIREARNVLTLPRRKTIEEHMNNPNRKCFHPPLPNDVALSVFIRGHKLVLAAYVLTFFSQNRKFDISSRSSVECVIPWVNDVIILLSYALDSCKSLLPSV